MARKRLEVMQVTPWVLQELRNLFPEDRKRQESYYLHHAHTALQWFGPLASRPNMPDGLNHVEVLLLFAGHGMQILGASNYRAWTAAKNLLHFQRMLYLRSLVIGAGTYPSNSALLHPSGGATWGPFHDNGADFFGKMMPRRKESNALVPASRIEQAVFHHLFPGALTDNPDAMAGLAAIGSFDTPSDRVNPIVASLRRAIKKCLLKYRISPGPVLEPWLHSWYPTVLDEIDETDLPAADTMEIVQAAEAGERQAASEIEYGEAPIADEEQARPTRDEATVESAQVAGKIRRLLEEGKLTMSSPGSPVHGFRGVPVLVWPAGLKHLAGALGIRDPEALTAVFLEHDWIELVDDRVAPDWVVFAPKEGGRRVAKAKVQVVPLSRQGVESLLPDGGVPDNPAMALPEEVEPESA